MNKKLEEKLKGWLFTTGAVKVCPEGKPFWYASGKPGPYYINTHFLFGGEERVGRFLELADGASADKKGSPAKLRAAALECYEADPVYHELMDGMCDIIRKNVASEDIGFISGGERRDWCFSFMAAEIMEKPHITIFKDTDTVTTLGDRVLEGFSAAGKKGLHIADLVTEASSYGKVWIPVIKKAGGSIANTVFVVDRMQGGVEFLQGQGIGTFSMIRIDKSLFEYAHDAGIISKAQMELVSDYIDDPEASMKAFAAKYPEFLKDSLAAGGKTAERARMYRKMLEEVGNKNV